VNAPNVTCPEFVGTALDRLVITTARFRMAVEELGGWPNAGAVFIADLPVSGLPVGAWAGSTN
jgi:sugar lactone lactonase YvrE